MSKETKISKNWTTSAISGIPEEINIKKISKNWTTSAISGLPKKTNIRIANN